MPDFDAIAVAVALRYAPAQVTPPAGRPNIRASTADLPNAVTVTPSMLIFTDQGTLKPGNGTREGVTSLLGRFYYSQGGDLARDNAALRAWLTVLVDQHRTGMQLGGIVTAIRTLTWTIGLMVYAQKQFTGIELGLQAVTAEPWSPTP